MTTKAKIIIVIATSVIAVVVIMSYVAIQNKKAATRSIVNDVLKTNIASTANT